MRTLKLIAAFIPFAALLFAAAALIKATGISPLAFFAVIFGSALWALSALAFLLAIEYARAHNQEKFDDEIDN